MKKIVLITYTVDSESDIQAIGSLRGVMACLPAEIVERFTAFDVLDGVSDLSLSE